MTLLGASFPQTESGTDPAAIRDWAIAVEEMGYDYILALDHVLGAKPGHPALPFLPPTSNAPLAGAGRAMAHRPTAG